MTIINQLYKFRALYNALAFNQLKDIECYKAKYHYDGTMPYDGYFIVVAILPTGQISNHYPMKYWDLFDIKAYKTAKHPFDGHTSDDVIDRLLAYLTEN